MRLNGCDDVFLPAMLGEENFNACPGRFLGFYKNKFMLM